MEIYSYYGADTAHLMDRIEDKLEEFRGDFVSRLVKDILQEGCEVLEQNCSLEFEDLFGLLIFRTDQFLQEDEGIKLARDASSD